MSHDEQRDFVSRIKSAFPSFFKSAVTLEIGSLDINGTIRNYFEDGRYIGLDVAPGPGVDVVAQGQEYDAPSDSFDTVISCEVMEHNPHWRGTLSNMIRVCRPGGLIVMTCASVGRREHGTTRSIREHSPLTVDLGWDYYRNLVARDFQRELPISKLLNPVGFFEHWVPRDLYMVGFKRGAPPPSNAEQSISDLQKYYRKKNWRYGLHSNYFKMRLLINLVGEDTYWAGPLRPGSPFRSKGFAR